MDAKRVNMYMLTIYIMHGSYGDVTMSHDL
jgi:hypothetical protein